MRPLLLEADEHGKMSLLANLSAHEDLMFNEHSVVFFKGLWYMFMRRHHKTHGVWQTTSPDLKTWSEPTLLAEKAQAPMAYVFEDRMLVAYRQILGEDHAGVVLREPLGTLCLTLDEYEGCVYDGGYADLFEMDGRLYVCYYRGNPEGEPDIRLVGLLP